MTRSLIATGLALVALGACTEPDVRHPTVLAVLSGNGQSGEVGTDLTAPVEVQVTDSLGRSVPHVIVHFEVAPPPDVGFLPGTTSSVSAETDGAGVARVRWILGTEAGTQTLSAWIGASRNSATSTIEVSAIARPGPSASIRAAGDAIVAITAGDSVPVAVTAADRYGNTIANEALADLTWQVVDASVARVTRTEVVTTASGAPARAATVLALTGGRTMLEARAPWASTLRVDLRVYVGPGREIAYGSGGAISVMSADGTVSVIRSTGSSPAWSPDGRQIAFSSSITFSGGAISVMNADGSGVRALTDSLTIRRARDPAWSPDGQRIAFVADSSDPGDALNSGARGALFVVNVDGSGLTRIAVPDDALCGSAGLCRGTQRPAWSPDGTRIAYSFFAARSTFARGLIFVVNADGSGLRELTSGVGVATEPAWSPDGSRIVMQSARITPPPFVQILASDIYAINADGTGLTQLTFASTKGKSDLSPAWSPDGRLAFTRTSATFSATNLPELFVANGDGTEARRVASPPGGATRPAWRPTP